MNALQLAAAVVVLAMGCTISGRPIRPDLDVVDVPPVGDVRTAELGETIVAKGRQYTKQVIELQNEVQGTSLVMPFRCYWWAYFLPPTNGLFVYPFMKLTLVLPPQALVAQLEDDGWRYFFAQEMLMKRGAERRIPGGLKISQSDPRNGSVTDDMGLA